MRIFVSSTSDDLSEYRAAVVEMLGRLGHDVVSMVSATADPRSAIQKCMADVKTCDVYLGLFAFHYGSIPNGYERSITEMEFREAASAGLPMLIFMVPKDTESWPLKWVDQGEDGVRVERLREELSEQDEFSVSMFHNSEELLTAVPQAMQNLALQEKVKAGPGHDPFEQYARPLRFDSEKSRHLPHFTGREWVAAKLDDWIENRRHSRVFCLLGGAGIGKSAIACNWSHNRDDVVAFHHCVFGHKDKVDPKRIMLSLAAQMAVTLPDFRRRLNATDIGELKEAASGDAPAVFDNLLMRPLSGDMADPGKDCLVIVDGLDEAGREQENELASFIGEVWGGLPSWLRLVVTARPELDVSVYLENLHPFILDAKRAENLEDIRVFLRRELTGIGQSFTDQVINEIVDKSEGFFLYAKVVLDEVQEGRLSLKDTSEFPEGLTGYYKRWFDRKFQDRQYYNAELHELISAIIAQRALLPVDTLAGALKLTAHEVRQRLLKLGVLFPLRAEQVGKKMVPHVTLMHKSLLDWLTEDNPATNLPRAGEFAADPELGNRLLADHGWDVYCNKGLAEHSYYRQTLMSHLGDAEDSERLTTVLFDVDLLDTLWSGEFRYEWQRQVSKLRHSVSLSGLVADWLANNAAPDSRGTRKAAVTGKLARLLQELGAFDEAVLASEAALEIWRANGVTDSPDMVGTLLALGRIQSLREELDKATASFEKALAIAERAYSQDSAAMADVLYDLCVFYTKGKRDYEKAWDYLQKTLEIHRRREPPNYAGIANCINDQAVIREAEEKVVDSLSLYREALELFEKASSDGHPEMVATLFNLANELRKRDRTDEALPYLYRAVALAKDVLLPQHDYAQTAHIALTNALLRKGQYDEALDTMRDHVAELERFPGPDSEEAAHARLQLCNALAQAWTLSERSGRDAYINETRRLCRQISDATPDTVHGLVGLARSWKTAAKHDLRDFLMGTARRLCRTNAARKRKTASEEIAFRCFSDVLLALIDGKPFADVVGAVRRIWAEVEPQIKHESDCLPKTRRQILNLLAWGGRVQLADNDDIDAVHLAFDLIGEIGAESPETLDTLSSLTVSLHNRRRDDVSESLCKRLLEGAERVLGKEHPQTMTYLTNYACISMYMGKFEQAEEMLRRVLEVRIRNSGDEQAGTLTTHGRLVQCLLLAGRTDDARAHVQDLVARLPEAEEFHSARSTLVRILSSIGMETKNKLGAYEQSRTCYELALEIDPANSTVHNNIALLLWVCLNDPDTAATHFEKSLELDGSNGVTRSNYALLLGQTMGKVDEAVRHFEEAMERLPNDHGIPANFASVLILKGEYERAWSLASRSMRLQLSSPTRIMGRALLCAASILALHGEDLGIPIGQMKTLLKYRINHVVWDVPGLLRLLAEELQPDDFEFIGALVGAVSAKDQYTALSRLPRWQAIEEISLDRPWPHFQPASVH